MFYAKFSDEIFLNQLNATSVSYAINVNIIPLPPPPPQKKSPHTLYAFFYVHMPRRDCSTI